MNNHCKPFIGEPMRISIKNQWKPIILLYKAALAAAWTPIWFENDTANAYNSVLPEVVDFDSGQDRSDLETDGAAG
jgi:hypothetical protein